MAENVYQMYSHNCNTVGFWIQRESWGNIVARVLSIDGQASGALPGKPPYYGIPKVIVAIYASADGTLKDSATLLSCPGNYSYREIEPPEWVTKINREGS